MDGGFREALLRQDGIVPGVLPASELEKVERLLARERVGIRWLKCGTAAAWILAIAVYVAGAVEAYLWPPLDLPGASAEQLTASQASPKLFFLKIFMPVEAAAMSIWLYLRRRSLNRRQVRVALLACEAELQALSGGKWHTAGPSG